MCKPLETGAEAFPIEFISQYVKNNKFIGFTLIDCSLRSLDLDQSCKIIFRHDTTNITVVLASLRKAEIALFNYDQEFSNAKASAPKVTCEKTDLQFQNGHYMFSAEFSDKSTMRFVCKGISAINGEA